MWHNFIDTGTVLFCNPAILLVHKLVIRSGLRKEKDLIREIAMLGLKPIKEQKREREKRRGGRRRE